MCPTAIFITSKFADISLKGLGEVFLQLKYQNKASFLLLQQSGAALGFLTLYVQYNYLWVKTVVFSITKTMKITRYTVGLENTIYTVVLMGGGGGGGEQKTTTKKQ